MKILFVGRETDMQRLMAFVEDTFAGKASVGFVTGEAGIGKYTIITD